MKQTCREREKEREREREKEREREGERDREREREIEREVNRWITVMEMKSNEKSSGRKETITIIIIRCQIWNRHWRPCLSKHLCHQSTSKNLNPYFVHPLPSYKDYQEMLFVVS